MNDGLLFLFIIWFWWIVFTFFTKKSYKNRFVFSLLCLLLLNVQRDLHGSFFIACFTLLSFSAYFMLRETFLKRIRLILFALIATVGYVGIKLIVLFDPVISIVSEKLFIAAILCMITIILFPRQVQSALILLCLTFVNGEWLLRLILYNLGLTYYRTNQFDLDVLAIALSAIFICTYICHKYHYWNLKQLEVQGVKNSINSHYKIVTKKAQ